jgi:hypothetical protein
VITPGTPQYKLAQVQQDARNNPKFTATGKRGTPQRKTYCNIATVWQLDQVGGNTDPLVDDNGDALQVNDQIKGLAQPGSGYHLATAEEAQDYTNSTGIPALAIQPNPGGHGHITPLVPEMVPGVGRGEGWSPLVNNIGAKKQVDSADDAFPNPDLPLSYYIPDK